MEKGIFIKQVVKTGSQVKPLLKYIIADNHKAETLFVINSLQEVLAYDSDLGNKSHISDVYLIIWFEEGEGKYTINFKKYNIYDGCVCFVSPGQILQFENLSRCNGYGIIFTEDFLCNMNAKMYNYIRNEIFDPYKCVSTCYIKDGKLAKEMELLINNIKDEYKGRKGLFGYKDKLASLLSCLIISLKRYGTWNNQNGHKSMNNDYSCYLEFIKCVEANFKHIHEVKEFAKVLHLSMGTLNKRVLNISGKRPSEIINERIVLEAKRMLAYSVELKVKQVACALGFTDVSNFVKFFKANVGITPVDFRDFQF